MQEKSNSQTMNEQEYVNDLISRLAEQVAHCLGSQLCLVKEARSYLEVRNHV